MDSKGVLKLSKALFTRKKVLEDKVTLATEVSYEECQR